MKARHNLEHIIFNSWKKNTQINDLKNYSGNILVGVSGGNDSMSLVAGLMQCLPKDKLIVVYCDHGPGKNTKHRRQANDVVVQFCRKNSLKCEVLKSAKELKSEAEFRDFRLSCFKVICQKYHIKIVALAHHRDDWLENQLIKLIRGSSFSSLRKNFQWSWVTEQEFYIWRPLCDSSRKDLVDYRQKIGILAVEDPSNKDISYFRNWIRHVWLPMLESHKPGRVNRLAISLINSIQEIDISDIKFFPWNFQTNSIDFVYFLSLTVAEKLRCLAFYVSSQGLKNVSATQLREIIKQLDTAGNHYHLHFKTFDCVVNAGQLSIKVRKTL